MRKKSIKIYETIILPIEEVIEKVWVKALNSGRIQYAKSLVAKSHYLRAKRMGVPEKQIKQWFNL